MQLETDFHIDTIECPECNTIQDAKVEHTLPWFTRIHQCINCKYLIMDSEWKIIAQKVQKH
jgi:uncharacterized protein (DUF2225 family)